MAEVNATSPGDKGSTQGQIKTPMCPENVDNQGGGKTWDFKGTYNLNAAGPSKGDLKTDNKIEGPGAQGNWDTQIRIKGDNTGPKY